MKLSRKSGLASLTYLSVVTLLIISCFLAGCSKRSNVVAKVGSQVITRTDYEQEMLKWYGSPEIATWKGLPDRIKVVESLIDEKLKLLDAYRLGLDHDSTVLAIAKEAQNTAAVQELYNTDIAEKLIPPEEIRGYYENLDKEIRVSHIQIKVPLNATDEVYTRAQIKADSLYDQLNAGVSFDSLASKFSQDRASANKGGDLGYVIWGKLPKDFQKAAFTMKVGELSHPVKTSYGFEIIRLDDRRVFKARGTFEQEKSEILKQLSHQYQAQLIGVSKAYLDSIKNRNRLQYDYINIQKILNRMSDVSVPRNISMFSDFSAEEKSWIVATTVKDTVRVKDLDVQIHKLERPPPILRDQQEIITIVEGKVVPVFLQQKAREKGLYDQPSVKKAYHDALESIMIGLVPTKEVNDRVNITDSHLKEYYKNHTGEFMTDTIARAQEILIKFDSTKGKDEVYAHRIAQRAQRGEDFTSLVHQYSDGVDKASPDGIIDPLRRRDYGILGRTAFDSGVGKVTDALLVENYYHIVRILNITYPRQMSFEEAKGEAYQKYVVQQNDSLSHIWWADMKKRFPVKINEKALMQVLPPPPSDSSRVGTMPGK